MCNPLDLSYLAVAQRAGVAPAIASFVVMAVRDDAERALDRGAVDGFDAEGCAVLGGIAEAQVDAVLAAMRAKGIIVEGRWTLPLPGRRAPLSGAERTRRCRARATAQRDATKNVTPVTAGRAEAGNTAEIKAKAGNGDVTAGVTPLKEGKEGKSSIDKTLRTFLKRFPARDVTPLVAPGDKVAARHAWFSVHSGWMLQNGSLGDMRALIGQWWRDEAERIEFEASAAAAGSGTKWHKTAAQREVDRLDDIRLGKAGPPVRERVVAARKPEMFLRE
jgi:hypothetical protein